MKRLIAGLAALCALTAANAQIADISAAEPLLRGTQSNLYNPVLSPDGSRLLFSDADYSNLRMYDFNLNATVTVSAEGRSGYDASFDADGLGVTFTTQTTARQGGCLRALCHYDIATQAVSTLAPASRRAPAVRYRSGDAAVRTEDATLYITSDGREQGYSPVEAAAYLWASLSPDGTKAMFVAAGKGVYITDLEGRVVSFAGNYEAPVWFGNDCIVAQKSTDDGHQFRSSQIVLVKADGSAVQEITRPESMTFTPAASIAAGHIVYSTIDGYLYQVTATLK